MNNHINPVVGVSTSFTGKYKASKLMIRFLEHMDIKIIKSSITKPEMIEAGTTLASAEFCLPLRVYIGHIYSLINHYPEINYILAPIIKGEHPNTSTCAKYRDLDGVIIRSLASMTGYRMKQSSNKKMALLNGLIDGETIKSYANDVKHLPYIISPEIESLDKVHLKQVCESVYSDLHQHSKWKRLKIKTNGWIPDDKSRKINHAFEQAYQEVILHQSTRFEKAMEDPSKIRLALLGRSYLVDDDALSADIKTYFRKKGVSVLTIDDVPFAAIKDRFEKVNGFYDYHRMAQAFIDIIRDQADGFIIIGSFGCHPDAFQIDYFTEQLKEHGKAVWTFKFDEQSGGVGFQTRFETILGFLEQKRNLRIKGNDRGLSEGALIEPKYKLEKENKSRNPVFIWPNMGTGIDLLIKEVWYQLGLDKYLYPPAQVDEETLSKGNNQYTETCSPFALYLGSLKETLQRLLREVETKKNNQEIVEPRRIIILMAGGKGPCTFGWYAIAGLKSLQKEFSTALAKYGYTLEMIAIDNEGRNLLSFLQELADVANNTKLVQVIEKLRLIDNQKISKIKKTKEEIELIRVLKSVVWPGWKKLLAYEELQDKALRVRAHEIIRGTTTKMLKRWVNELDVKHDIVDILEVNKLAIKELEQIEQDKEIKPKVVVVGEIYVALTPFANRGTVDNLLGMLGIEAIEGMRLSHFIKGAFKGLKYHYIQSQELLKPILRILEINGIYKVNKWVREPDAKPFLEHEIGGDGQPTVAHARHHIEQDGVDGILHIYPFKCMPEGMAKDALKEMSQIYGIKSLHLSFDKEIEIERLRTELGTFASLLQQDLGKRKEENDFRQIEIKRRKAIGQVIEEMYQIANKR